MSNEGKILKENLEVKSDEEFNRFLDSLNQEDQ